MFWKQRVEHIAGIFSQTWRSCWFRTACLPSVRNSVVAELFCVRTALSTKPESCRAYSFPISEDWKSPPLSLGKQQGIIIFLILRVWSLNICWIVKPAPNVGRHSKFIHVDKRRQTGNKYENWPIIGGAPEVIK